MKAIRIWFRREPRFRSGQGLLRGVIGGTVARQFPGVNRLRRAERCEMDTSLKGGFANRFRGSGRECGAQERIIATSRRLADPALRKTESVLKSLNRLKKSHKHTACGIFCSCDRRGRRSLRSYGERTGAPFSKRALRVRSPARLNVSAHPCCNPSRNSACARTSPVGWKRVHTPTRSPCSY